jgi:Domain of unknown function (DUF4303)
VPPTPTPPTAGFDFAALEARIIAASKLAFEDVRQAHAAEQICAFALYSDDGAMTVCPAFDLLSRRAARIGKDPDEANYQTFGAAEWALEAFGAREAFKDICTTVRTFVLDNLDHPYQGLASWGVNLHATGFESFKQQLFETCQLALEKLRSEGTFDAYPDLLVMFAVSDDGLEPADERRMMQRLNGASPYVDQFRRWHETFGL